MSDEAWRQQRAQELWGEAEPWFIRESRRRTSDLQDNDLPEESPAVAGLGAQPEERRAPPLQLVRDKPPLPEPDTDLDRMTPAAAPSADNWRAARDHPRTVGEGKLATIGTVTARSPDDGWRVQREHPAVGARLSGEAGAGFTPMAGAAVAMPSQPMARSTSMTGRRRLQERRRRSWRCPSLGRASRSLTRYGPRYRRCRELPNSPAKGRSIRMRRDPTRRSPSGRSTGRPQKRLLKLQRPHHELQRLRARRRLQRLSQHALQSARPRSGVPRSRAPSSFLPSHPGSADRTRTCFRLRTSAGPLRPTMPRSRPS
jgi:hypothetical protein